MLSHLSSTFCLWIGSLFSGEGRLHLVPFSNTVLSDQTHKQYIVLLLLLLLSTRLQTPTDGAKCHKPKGTSREGNPKKEKINRNEGKKDKNTI